MPLEGPWILEVIEKHWREDFKLGLLPSDADGGKVPSASDFSL